MTWDVTGMSSSCATTLGGRPEPQGASAVAAALPPTPAASLSSTGTTTCTTTLAAAAQKILMKRSQDSGEQQPLSSAELKQTKNIPGDNNLSLAPISDGNHR